MKRLDSKVPMKKISLFCLNRFKIKRNYNQFVFKKKYYAVARGHKIGIFETWDECSQQVLGFKDAKFKSFPTKEEAENFIYQVNENIYEPVEKSKSEILSKQEENTKVSNTLSIEEKEKLLNLDPKDVVVVYTDGSFREEFGGGIGCFFGDKDSRNISEKFPYSNPTNQRAELYASIRALQVIPEDKIVEIRTDSLYVINSVTKWSKNWENNGWMNSKGKDVENQELIKELLEIIKNRKGMVFWTHVRGHRGEYGNEMADKLAGKGSEKNV